MLTLQKCTKRQYIKKDDGKHYYYVILNDEKIYEEVNLIPTTFNRVMVFLSTQLHMYKAANGKVRNLKYRTNDENCLEFCLEFCTTTSTAKITSTTTTASTTKATVPPNAVGELL